MMLRSCQPSCKLLCQRRVPEAVELDTFSSFFTQFRLVTAAAEKQGKTDLAENVCEKEGGKLLHWCDQAAQHMDEVTLLNKSLEVKQGASP